MEDYHAFPWRRSGVVKRFLAIASGRNAPERSVGLHERAQ